MEQPISPTSTDGDERAEIFSAVLPALDKGQLLLVASRLRSENHPKANKLAPCLGDPIYGSYHVVLPLEFDDGCRWVAKLPINGTSDSWDEASTIALTSEAETMQALKRDTTIPLPEVFSFSSTTQNVLGCP